MFALTILSVPTFAQTFNTLGIGIASPQGTLHVHTSQGYNYDGPIRDGLYPYAEVEEDGLSVGEMNKVLMQKVEELTLYVIELQKQINDLKNTIQ